MYAACFCPPSISPFPHAALTGDYQRVLTYNDGIGWITTAIAFLCMVAAGVLLPLMNVVFGRFVTVLNDFATGRKTADDFRSAVNQYT